MRRMLLILILFTMVHPTPAYMNLNACGTLYQLLLPLLTAVAAVWGAFRPHSCGARLQDESVDSRVNRNNRDRLQRDCGRRRAGFGGRPRARSTDADDAKALPNCAAIHRSRAGLHQLRLHDVRDRLAVDGHLPLDTRSSTARRFSEWAATRAEPCRTASRSCVYDVSVHRQFLSASQAVACRGL